MAGQDRTDSSLPGPTWCIENPELWPLLVFEVGHDENGGPIDLAAGNRRQVLEELVRRPGLAELEFARFLLVQETHAHGHYWGSCYGIEIAAILVAEHRQVEDVWLLWEAVHRSFDTMGIMPHQIVYAAGVEHTLQYVIDSDHPRRNLLLEDLRRMADTTDEQVARLLADRRRHHASGR